MKRSSERFLTTHTGSLPRPDDLIRMMYAKEGGVPVDAAALAARVREAVSEVVSKQVEAGVDLVNDGEMSKPSYATYIKDRLDGFGGTGNTFVYQDLAEFPGWRSACSAIPAARAVRRPACNAPISVRDAYAARADTENLKAAIAGAKAIEAFMSAASPGVVSFSSAMTTTRITRTICMPLPRLCVTNTRPWPRPESCCKSTAPILAWVDISSTRT